MITSKVISPVKTKKDGTKVHLPSYTAYSFTYQRQCCGHSAEHGRWYADDKEFNAAEFVTHYERWYLRETPCPVCNRFADGTYIEPMPPFVSDRHFGR